MNRAIIILSCLVAMAVISHVTMRIAHGYALTPQDQPSTGHASNTLAPATSPMTLK